MNEKPNIAVVADEAALANELAAFVARAAGRALESRKHFAIALAGGSTPAVAYRLLARPPFSASIDWSRVRFFFSDERCVPPNDDRSNYKMAKTTMFDALKVTPDTIFRMRGEDEPQDAARAYARTLQRELPTGDAGTPVFDLVMLGMGPDGHTASLFPGTDPLADDDLLVKAPYVAQFSTYRITLTPRVINAAREVVVATAGTSKATALAAVLDGARDPKKYPIQIVRPRHGQLTWLVDRAAIAESNRTPPLS